MDPDLGDGLWPRSAAAASCDVMDMALGMTGVDGVDEPDGGRELRSGAIAATYYAGMRLMPRLYVSEKARCWSS